MNYRILDSVSSGGPSSAGNSCLVGSNDFSVWMLDGRESFASAPIVAASRKADLDWFVMRSGEALKDFGDIPEADIKDVIHNVISFLRISLDDEMVRVPDGASDIPVASLAVVKFIDGILEFGVLGDIRIIIKKSSGEIFSVGAPHLMSILKSMLNEKISELSSAGVSDVGQRRKMLENVLMELRKICNVDGGYWMLGVDHKSAENLSEGIVHVSEGDKVMIMSDGFYRLISVFGKHTDESIFDAAEKHGLEELLSMLRIVENSDADCISHPRITASDDASCVLIQI